MDLIVTIAATLVTLLVVVSVHEFGHFWVARRCGVEVERFSIGFGRPLWRWRDRRGTEFVIAALPLGGYVKMLDEQADEFTPGREHLAFNRKPVWSRIAIIAAGPLANLLLAVLAYWFLYLGGETGVAPVIESVRPGSPAAEAGLAEGQEIVAIDGRATPTWQAVRFRLLGRIGESGPLRIVARNPGSDARIEAECMLRNWLAEEESPDLVAGLGIEAWRPPVAPLLEEVAAGSAAEAAGLRPGDRLVAADGVALADWAAWAEYVRARPDTPILVELERQGRALRATLTPAGVAAADGRRIGRAGTAPVPPEWPEHMLRHFRHGPLDALALAGQRTWQLIAFTVDAIKKMLAGLISHKHLSGPITIAKVAGDSAEYGFRAFVGFVALLSVSLGVLNLLPIPVLDGGHLLFCAIEVLAGRPVPGRWQVLGYKVGTLVIIGIMLMAIYNDLGRL